MRGNPWRDAVVKGAICMLATLPLLASPVRAGVEEDRPEAVVRMAYQGRRAEAARLARQALEQQPGDPILQNLAGVLLTGSGLGTEAEAAWDRSLADRPGDPIALYGKALTLAARGNLAQATEFLALCPKGDPDAMAILGRYLGALRAVPVGATDPSISKANRSADLCLQGMASARRGELQDATDRLVEAMKGLTGDPFGEPDGLLLTFDTTRPIAWAGERVPQGTGLASSGTATGAPASGTIQLQPDDVPSAVGFVSFKVDGRPVSVVNTPPYRFQLDTTRIANGPHSVEIVFHDSGGAAFNTVARTIRTWNNGAPGMTGLQRDRQARLEGMLWAMLTPHPSRLSMAYVAGISCRARGDMAGATRYLRVAAGIDPDHGVIREVLERAPVGTGEPIWKVPGRRFVALTFDDGPRPGMTERILAVLKAEGVKATFFVIGRHVAAYPALAASLHSAGMELENHSYTHANLAVIPPAVAETELLRASAAIEAATGRAPRYFRPPGGNTNVNVTRVAQRWGMSAAMWTVNAERLENVGPDALAGYVIEKTKPGSIILLHNGRAGTVEALPAIIRGIRAKGLEFATLEDLLTGRVAGRNRVE